MKKLLAPTRIAARFWSNDLKPKQREKRKMRRAVVSKYILDEMIRARIGDQACAGVKPLPVAWRARSGDGCNWIVSGWTGDSEAVRACTERLMEYLRSLRSQFDIPEEG